MIAPAFRDIWSLGMFLKFSNQTVLACGSCNFENFKSITRAHTYITK